MPTGVYPRLEPFERFVTKVHAPDALACWPWKGSRTSDGYGQFSLNGRSSMAHRFACEVAYGPIPDGLVVDHLCCNPPCVNPAHLEPVTMGENTRRGSAFERRAAQAKLITHCIRGHAFDGANLAFDRSGHRVCKACRSLLTSQWRVENRDRVNACQRIRRARAA